MVTCCFPSCGQKIKWTTPMLITVLVLFQFDRLLSCPVESPSCYVAETALGLLILLPLVPRDGTTGLCCRDELLIPMQSSQSFPLHSFSGIFIPKPVLDSNNASLKCFVFPVSQFEQSSTPNIFPVQTQHFWELYFPCIRSWKHYRTIWPKTSAFCFLN